MRHLMCHTVDVLCAGSHCAVGPARAEISSCSGLHACADAHASHAAAKPKAAFTFVIGMDRYGDFPRIPLHYLSAVLNSCARRLDEPVTVEVVTATRDMSRSDAILRAKAEKEAHVVWLELQAETLSARSRPNEDPLNVTIEYSVFAPITAKRVTSGRAYPSAYRNRGVIVSPRTGGIYGGDYQLNKAAEEAADQILEHFHLGIIRTRLNRD